MSDICSQCKQDLLNLKDKIKCSECSSYFHSSCSRIGSVEKLRKLSAAKRFSWKCDMCSVESSSTHSRSDNDNAGDNMQIADMFKALRSDINSKFDQQLKRFDNMEANYASLTHSFANINTVLDELKKETNEQKQVIGSLKEENRKLSRDVEELKDNLQDLQQYTRRNNVEIQGIPLTENEDIYLVLQTLAEAMDLQFYRQDISVAHRLSRSRKYPSPAIIVAFLSRSTKSMWLEAAKKRKPSTTDLSTSFKKAPVYINDHLSPFNRQLLGLAREMKKEGKFAYAWFKDGCVRVRVSEDSRPLRIKRLSDLEGY